MMHMTYTAGRGAKLMLAGLLMLLDCMLDGAWRAVKGAAGLLWRNKLHIAAVLAAAALGAAVPQVIVCICYMVMG